MPAVGFDAMAESVSPELLDYFTEGLECWNRDELDVMQGMYAKDGVFDVSAVFPDVAPMRGHEDMRRYWNQLRETWDGIRQDPIDAFDLGDGRYWSTCACGAKAGAAASRSISASRCSTSSVPKTTRSSTPSSSRTWRRPFRWRSPSADSERMSRESVDTVRAMWDAFSGTTR